MRLTWQGSNKSWTTPTGSLDNPAKSLVSDVRTLPSLPASAIQLTVSNLRFAEAVELRAACKVLLPSANAAADCKELAKWRFPSWPGDLPQTSVSFLAQALLAAKKESLWKLSKARSDVWEYSGYSDYSYKNPDGSHGRPLNKWLKLTKLDKKTKKRQPGSIACTQDAGEVQAHIVGCASLKRNMLHCWSIEIQEAPWGSCGEIGVGLATSISRGDDKSDCFWSIQVSPSDCEFRWDSYSQPLLHCMAPGYRHGEYMLQPPSPNLPQIKAGDSIMVLADVTEGKETLRVQFCNGEGPWKSHVVEHKLRDRFATEETCFAYDGLAALFPFLWLQNAEDHDGRWEGWLVQVVRCSATSDVHSEYALSHSDNTLYMKTRCDNW